MLIGEGEGEPDDEQAEPHQPEVGVSDDEQAPARCGGRLDGAYISTSVYCALSVTWSRIPRVARSPVCTVPPL